MAKGLTILRKRRLRAQPGGRCTPMPSGHGWRASYADELHEVATSINEGRIIQGVKSAPLRDDVLDYWRVACNRWPGFRRGLHRPGRMRTPASRPAAEIAARFERRSPIAVRYAL
jgi:hypothetical protein